MAINWGPHFIVPSEVARTFSGIVVLRENFDEALLRKELETLGLSGAILKVTNPWYYRRKEAISETLKSRNSTESDEYWL